MASELMSFLERPIVRRVVCAVLIGSAVVGLLQALFQGLVYTPLLQAAPRAAPGIVGLFLHDPGTWVVAGRVVDWGTALSGLLTLALAVVFARRLWQDDDGRPSTDCVHCTSAVPVGAGVCWACTRDLA